jgi:hypothetical protein
MIFHLCVLRPTCFLMTRTAATSSSKARSITMMLSGARMTRGLLGGLHCPLS